MAEVEVEHAVVGDGYLVFRHDGRAYMDLNQLARLTGFYRGYLRRTFYDHIDTHPLHALQPANMPLIELLHFNTVEAYNQVDAVPPPSVEWTATDDVRRVIREHNPQLWGLGSECQPQKSPWVASVAE